MKSSLATVTYEAEPDFFTAMCPAGAEHNIVTCRDRLTKDIVGFGCRSVRPYFVNGVPRRIGYLSSLRCRPKYQNMGLVARGYRAMRDLHEADGATEWYYTTILGANDRALRLLTSGRAGLPFYHFVGNYTTFLVPTAHPRLNSRQADVKIEEIDQLTVLQQFLNSTGKQRQLFPQHLTGGWLDAVSRKADVGLRVWGAQRGGSIVGAIGSIDQTGIRQFQVQQYVPWLQALRKPLNVWNRLRRRPLISAAPCEFRYLTVMFPVLEDDEDPNILIHLLDHVVQDARERGFQYVAIGCHESERSYPLLRSLSAQCFDARMYLVSWDHTSLADFKIVNQRFYLELGWL